MLKSTKQIFLTIGALSSIFVASLPAQNGSNKLTVVESYIPQSFDILREGSTEATRLGGLFFAKLYGYNVLGEIIPILADKALVADGKPHKTFRVQLRSGLRWSGSSAALDAQDVKFTYDHIKKQNSANHWSNQYIAAVNVSGTSAVDFVFTQPIYLDLMQGIFTIPIYPKVFGGVSSIVYFARPTGIGPFAITSRPAPDVIELERNEGFPLGAPKIPLIEIKRVPNKDNQFVEITNKSVDVVPDLPAIYAHQIDADPQLVLKPYNLQEYNYFAYNMRRPGFKDKRVRQAFTRLANRGLMLRTLYGGSSNGRIITGPLTPDSEYYNAEVDTNLLSFNEAEADRLLREAETARVFDRTKPLSFKVPITGEQSTESVCLLFRQQLIKRNINVEEIEFLDPAAWAQKVFVEHDYDITYGVWTYGESAELRSLFHSSEMEAGGLNFVGYVNAVVDNLLNQIYASGEQLEPEVIREKFHRVHALIYDDCPYTFLFKLVKFAGLNQRVQRVTIQPANFYQFIHEWEVR